ncbi:CbiX/SirB N-terminal domain-containing protein [Thioclava atlantica]|uniref:Cobalamin biosynthesis protein CbiX n=1 Tax=Thioclava atlantica TaxID=1317124 RepID=A0A085TWU0_9RHOB|nr:CbiX/SirB N-terminal domain-containing protein [Thioclava atlantica]KFE35187.1 cobalamin biosynthesis protein CbiX [Thioclava atlantica]
MNPVVIVAHGSPSDPETQEAALKSLASSVGDLLPGRTVRSATLASRGALEAALDGLDDPWIYPFFMAEGWFTKTELPRRIADMGVKARVLRPFGVDPELSDLIARVVISAATESDRPISDLPLILVAHGSKVARRSRDSVYDMAESLAQRRDMPPIHVALIEEPPYLEDVAKELGDGICLPFFALRAGHVQGDIPEALQQAGYRGLRLAEIGAHREVPALVAKAIARG